MCPWDHAMSGRTTEEGTSREKLIFCDLTEMYKMKMEQKEKFPAVC